MRIDSSSILPENEYIRIPTESGLLYQVHLIRFDPPLYRKQFLKPNLEPSPHPFIKIDKYGYVDRVSIIESPAPQVSKAILKVARKWVFQLPDENPKPGPYHFTSWLFYSPLEKNTGALVLCHQTILLNLSVDLCQSTWKRSPGKNSAIQS